MNIVGENFFTMRKLFKEALKTRLARTSVRENFPQVIVLFVKVYHFSWPLPHFR